MGIIVAVLIALLFFTALFFTSKNWRISHVVLLFGLFAMTATFLILAAMTLKTHEAWKSKYKQLTSDIERTEANIAMLETGDLQDPESASQSIAGMKKRLENQIIGRGRVWRSVQLAGGDGRAIALNMAGWGSVNCYGEPIDDDEELEPEPDPVSEPADTTPADDGSADDGGDNTAADEDPATPPAGDGGADDTGEAEAPAPTPPAPAPAPAGPATEHGIAVGTVLHAFLEGPSSRLAPEQQKALFGNTSELPANDRRGACRVPVRFVGSFSVSQVNGNSVVIQPLFALDAQQQQLVQGRQGTWALYELMPVDGHDLAGDFNRDGEVNPDDAAQMAAVFPNSPFRQDILAEYRRDMQPAAAGDSPSQTMVKVKFLKEHTEVVDAEKIAEVTSVEFDDEGRAALPTLIQGAPTTFAVDDELYVLDNIAREWAGQGICERTEDAPTFVRPLRDYDLMFQANSKSVTEVQSQIGIFVKDNKTITDAATVARGQIKFREDEIKLIQADQKNVESELQVLSNYVGRLKQFYQDQRQTLSGLYRMNSQNADGLRGPVVQR